MHYLFGFSGRINRAKIWLFILISLVVEAITFVIAAKGFKWTGFWDAFTAQTAVRRDVDWLALPWPHLDTPLAWGSLAAIVVIFVLLTWASLAVMVKRLHDRAKSAWWLLLYWGAPLVVSMAQQCPIVRSWIYAEPKIPAVTWAVLGTSLAVFALDIWIFIDLYCLRGTKGENDYGPDPLEKA
ncbi:uncharacterized membrane protein YhaH (DUF805 family) [Rhizomicrobium palustre]|uniref:Uncharacterized membrane protein YhaH (DUF805 family) n=1 Tax=Rhizomicrobium palustre TaxID=189966 RepID=A0A846N441_9PROT|nr:DUF805 domain-containing protein [Rhizomicrobium palustre]NIK90496.1 uncharacterized membrane protein YhaH (DUF805 family) [Rhizomicrobium palustre]